VSASVPGDGSPDDGLPRWLEDGDHAMWFRAVRVVSSRRGRRDADVDQPHAGLGQRRLQVLLQLAVLHDGDERRRDRNPQHRPLAARQMPRGQDVHGPPANPISVA
jgi:hypothetical protein